MGVILFFPSPLPVSHPSHTCKSPGLSSLINPFFSFPFFFLLLLNDLCYLSHPQFPCQPMQPFHFCPIASPPTNTRGTDILGIAVVTCKGAISDLTFKSSLFCQIPRFFGIFWTPGVISYHTTTLSETANFWKGTPIFVVGNYFLLVKINWSQCFL